MWNYGYDAADQLAAATKKTTAATPAILSRYGYAYDRSGNRTTEQWDNAPTTSTYNNMNELTGQQGGGAVFFRGVVNEPATVNVTVTSPAQPTQPATVTAANQFEAQAQLGSSANTVQATDPSGNVRTNTYQVTESGSSKALTYDLNGNLTNDVTRTFEWDAGNRLTATVQGTHRSEFTYDGESRRVRIIEKDNGSTTSDRRYIWCGMEICEQRDGTGTIVQRPFYNQGFLEGTSKYFYAKDHFGEHPRHDGQRRYPSATVRVRPYGRPNAPAGSQPPKWSTFRYAGHFIHWDSGQILAPYRGYLPAYGRWTSEDPIGLAGGDVDLYRYVGNAPTTSVDPTGFLQMSPALWQTGAAIGAAAGAAAAVGLSGGTIAAIALVALVLTTQTGDIAGTQGGGGGSSGSGAGTGTKTTTTTTTTTGPTGPPPPPPPTPPSPVCTPSPDPCNQVRVDCANRCRGATMSRGSFKVCYEQCLRIMSKGLCKPL